MTFQTFSRRSPILRNGETGAAPQFRLEVPNMTALERDALRALRYDIASLERLLAMEGRDCAAMKQKMLAMLDIWRGRLADLERRGK